MKFSENWLRSLVDPRADRAELVRRLTMAGLEVESLEALGEGLDGVVVGEIVACEKHPNADKLRVCQVAIGRDAPLQIVCGAPNARLGLKAPLATIGATLPNGVSIKQAALRGVDSHGMLCSAKELALGEGTAGLLELPADAPVGESLAKYLDLPDATIELKLTPNRPDCLGLRGLASEVATLFAVDKRDVAIDAVPVTSKATRDVVLEASADCPRYLGRVIEGVNARAPTPLWMVERLRRAGLRSISAVVDCSNYVLLELGQPTHAFDNARLQGGVVARRARAGEVLKLLDEREVKLDGEFLVIADQAGAQAVAGVMGGFESRVTDDTRDLFLEAAHFTPASIVGRARRLGLHTDASHRFERGVDPELPRLALERLTRLIIDIAGGQAGPVIEAEARAALPKPIEVSLRADRLLRVLGMPVPRERVGAILRGLDMQVTETAEGWRVIAPSRRFDIAIEEDLIEEVARVFGYDAVPTKSPGGLLQVTPEREGQVSEAHLRRAMIARGYSEAVNFAFVSAAQAQAWTPADQTIALANPLSADLSTMRGSLLPGLIEALKRNLARQQTRVRLFELGRVIHRVNDAPMETPRLAGVICGTAQAEQWGVTPSRAVDYFDIKGDLELVLALGSGAASFEFAPSVDAQWHPGRSAEIRRDGRRVGVIGALHPRLAKALDLATDVYAFELDLAPVLARGVPRAAEQSRFPLVRRDIAVVLDASVPFAAIRATVAAAVGPQLRDFVLFDQYAGKGLIEGTRSLAMGLILQDHSRTLTDQDADQAVASSVAALAREFGARLRS